MLQMLDLRTQRSKIGWKATNAGVAALAAMGTNWALHEAWLRFRDTEPPLNPISEDTGWKEALVWAGLLGLAVGMAQLAARRGAAEGWRKAFGKYPKAL